MSQFLSTQPYKGTRDFYPEDMRIRNWMFSRIKNSLKSFGYQEYDGPMLEPFELYASKTSEEIVNEQLYWMIDRGERKLAVRPEMTPTLARMVAAKVNELPKPIRWFSIPNLWRYERPQRGRLREHWQLNVDLFSGNIFEEDLEICQVITSLMESFGAKKGYEVRLNHRALTNTLFKNFLGLSDEKIPVVGRLFDAAPKMGLPDFEEALKKEGLEQKQIQPLKDLLSHDPESETLKKFKALPEYSHLEKLLSTLSSMGYESVFKFDPSIMRGFLYYTGMVLEVYDTHPDNNRALFGGGRYDNLIGMFGNTQLSGVGFGMGDVTLQNFLTTHQLLPQSLNAPSGLYVAPLFEEQKIAALEIAQKLRQSLAPFGVSVLNALQADKMKKIFSVAEKLNVQFILFVGPDDLVKGEFPIKDLVTKEQNNVTLSSATPWISSHLKTNFSN